MSEKLRVGLALAPVLALPPRDRERGRAREVNWMFQTRSESSLRSMRSFAANPPAGPMILSTMILCTLFFAALPR